MMIGCHNSFKCQNPRVLTNHFQPRIISLTTWSKIMFITGGQKTMIYGYARVSTTGQAKDGHSLEAQKQLLEQNGAQFIYSDSASGKTTDRPAFHELMTKLCEGDTLIITKLDRVARSLYDGSKLVDELIQRGVKVNILNIGLLDNSPANKLIRHIFFGFAEFERDMIAERTREGKAVARTKAGFKEGRPKKFTDEQIAHALTLLETHSYKQVERMTQISISTLVRAKRKKSSSNKEDPFYSPQNQQHLERAAERMENTGGQVHEIIDTDNIETAH